MLDVVADRYYMLWFPMESLPVMVEKMCIAPPPNHIFFRITFCRYCHFGFLYHHDRGCLVVLSLPSFIPFTLCTMLCNTSVYSLIFRERSTVQ
jgi:hypothetical protein